MIRIRKGLELPIRGEPEQVLSDGAPVRHVALLGGDYHGMKPTMALREGDPVRKGEVLFTDKKTPGVAYTAPAGGRVVHVHRGAKRALQSVVVELPEGEPEPELEFRTFPPDALGTADRDTLVSWLVETGLWTALRTRPFSRVPEPAAEPSALFVNLMDSNPLAADPEVVLAQQGEALAAGIALLSRLAPRTFVVRRAGSAISVPELSNVEVHEFAGPHPAGLVGTHIHFLHPVGATRSVWSVQYPDAVSIGATALSGRLHTERIVALGGAPVRSPQLLRTRVGACVSELVGDRVETDPRRIRLVSGSVLSGHRAHGPLDFLGRLHVQVSVLREDDSRQMLHFLRPGTERHSVLPAFASAITRPGDFEFTTSRNGSARAMVPVSAYERVMPLDILPTQLLRALLVGDIDGAIALGALELDEEDLALCTYACPGKYEYGPVLRKLLDRVHREG